MANETHKVIIIGSGPAGLTAAIYAGRAGLAPVVVAGYEPGGQLMQTTEVENFPGFPEGIQGPALMTNFIKQAERWGAKLIYENVESVELAGSPKKITTSTGKQLTAEAIILATGALPRKLTIPGEEEYWGKGVSSCATCDGAFFKNREVAVIGGGDSAMEEATFLTHHASKVYVIHRRDELRASKVMQERAMANEKIEFIWNAEVREVLGDKSTGKVDRLKLWDNQEQKEFELNVDGMFLAIGHIPVTGYMNGVSLTDEGYVSSIDGVHTNIEGVFVAGDVEDHKYRQAITAAGAGCRAALDAQKWLELH